MMGKLVLTEELARAAATDAGNRSAREHGRKAWNRQDYNRAVQTYNRLARAAQGKSKKRVMA